MRDTSFPAGRVPVKRLPAGRQGAVKDRCAIILSQVNAGRDGSVNAGGDLTGQGLSLQAAGLSVPHRLLG